MTQPAFGDPSIIKAARQSALPTHSLSLPHPPLPEARAWLTTRWRKRWLPLSVLLLCFLVVAVQSGAGPALFRPRGAFTPSSYLLSAPRGLVPTLNRLPLVRLLAAGYREPRRPTSFIPGTRIPRLIHQTWKTANLSAPGVPRAAADAAASWERLNPGYELKLWTDDEVASLVDAEFPRLSGHYRRLRPGAQRADLARYLLLWLYGGVYTDVDTVCLKPVDAWPVADGDPPPHSSDGGEDGGLEALLGIELDCASNWNWWDMLPRQLQIVQWTLAARPRHPVFGRAIGKVAEVLDWLEATGGEAGVRKMPTMELTGPGLWTDAVADWMRLHGRHLRNLADLEHAVIIDGIKFLHMTAFNPTNTDQKGKGVDDPASLVEHIHIHTWKDSEGT